MNTAAHSISNSRTTSRENSKYRCSDCGFPSEYVADIWEHTFKKHPEKEFQFNQKQTQNMIMKIIAEHTVGILEEMETIKKDMKGAFQQMADIMEESVGSIKDDTNVKCKTLADAMLKLYGKVKKIDASTNPLLKPSLISKNKSNKKNIPTKTSTTKPTLISSKSATLRENLKSKHSSTSNTSSKAASRTSPHATSNPSAKQTSSASTSSKESKTKSAFNSCPKILYVADSVGHSTSAKQLENSSHCRIRTARAYSSVHDINARWPECNFTDMVAYALENPGRDNFDALVLSSPTVDISNLDTSKLNAFDNTEFFQQKAITSSKNIFSLAQKTLQQNQSLSKL